MSETPSEIIQGWKVRATPDYFSMFQSLWVAFNAWYKDWWLSAHSLSSSTRDRDYIEKLKLSWSHNRIYTNFSNLLVDDSKWATFRFYLQDLDAALKNISFENNIDKEFRNTAASTITSFRMVKTIFDRKEYQRPTPARSLDTTYELCLFQATIEILYTVRNKFFHGERSPNEQNLRVVKDAYHVLYALMENI